MADYRKLIVFAALLALAGCGLVTRAPQTANACAAAPDSATGVRLALVRQQMAAGKYHAALAHLDGIGSDAPEALLLRARASRAIADDNAATASYRALLHTCMKAYGYQGLGTLAADRGDLTEALAQLQQARQLAPTDADVRNDYGFALLAAGEIDAALGEFRTAVELQTGDRIALSNLVVTLFIAGRDEEARTLATGHALGTADIETLAQRARHFHPMTNALGEDPAHARR